MHHQPADTKISIDRTWPEWLKGEFAANGGNAQVGSRLLSVSDRVRVWHLSLAPGDRLPVHCHVLDYFWTALTAGRARSHYHDGRTQERDYASGDTAHYRFAAGEFMLHDLENIGDQVRVHHGRVPRQREPPLPLPQP